MVTKVCRKCGGDPKPLGDFYAHPKMADGHLNICKVCFSAYNKEQAKKRDPEKERDRLAAWRAANPEAWKTARNRAYEKSKTNGTAARSAKTRKAREKAASVGTISLKGVLADHGMHCFICDKPIADEKQLTFDHVIPLARGGQHTAENLRPAHRSCNSWKLDRLPEELVGLTPPEPGEFDDWEARRQEKANKLRGEATRARMAAMTPEERTARGQKISEGTKGKTKRQFGPRAPRGPVKPETISKRSASSKATWANKTPEVQARAVQASADARRGVPETPEQRAAISAGLRLAYAEGRRTRGHSEETRRKISETKRQRSRIEKGATEGPYKVT